MKTELLTMGHLPDRRSFIGGSDARIIMGDDEAAFLPPEAEQGGFVVAHDDAGVRAADKVAAVRRIAHCQKLCFHDAAPDS